MKITQKGFKRGGVHPPERKSLSLNDPIRSLPLPRQLTLPLAQHIGAPSNPLVGVGDRVVVGQKIAEAVSVVSAALHSPADATVTALSPLQLPNGIKTQAIVLEVDDEQHPPVYTETPFEALTEARLLSRIAEGGIVGAGGAAFPTPVKLKVPKGTDIDFLIINGAECEPYLNADNLLMQTRPLDILKGVQIVQRLVHAARVVVGVEANKPKAIRVLAEAVREQSLPITVQPLRVRYPQGDEKQLIQAVTGREVPSGALPSAVGCVVVNVATCFAVYEAVCLQKPFYERLITLSGGSVAHPGQWRVPIGASVRSVVEAAGGLLPAKPVAKWVMGGPMMGFSFYDPDQTFVTKGTGGILALSFREAFTPDTTACLNCGRCIRVCPMGLQPTKMFKYIHVNEFGEAVRLGLFNCKECGSCAFICPAKIPLVQGFKFAKSQVRS